MLTGARSRLALFAGIIALGLSGVVPEPLESQVPPVVRGASRAIKWGRDVLVAYGATEFLDHALGLDGALEELLGVGRDIERELDALGDRLSVEASVNSANRTILLRHAAFIEELRNTVSRLSQGTPPSTEEADGFRREFSLAVEEVQGIQEDYGRRIGRLEEGLDSLRQLLGSLPETPSAPGVPARESAVLADNPPQAETIVTRFLAGPLALSVELVGLTEDPRGASIVLSLTAEGTGSSGEAVLCARNMLIDDQAGEWRLTQSSGLARTGPFNIIKSSRDGVAFSLADHTTFVPGIPQTAILRFGRATSPPRLPSQVILNMECYRRRGDWDERFSITSPGIPVRYP